MRRHWKCTLGFHTYEYSYVSDDSCLEIGICGRCKAKTTREEHDYKKETRSEERTFTEGMEY
ncbi:MAG: hypothetical protein PVF45_09215, partial [Anaerolineae bacterium]